MDGVVSWQEAMLIAKLHYPKADMSTILYFAKTIYLAKYKINVVKEAKVKERVELKIKKPLILQGASA